MADARGQEVSESSGEVVNVDAKTGEILPPQAPQSPVELIHALVTERAARGIDPDVEVMDRILMSILMADSMDDVLDDNEPLGADDVLDVPITLHGVSFTESDVPDARIPYYATLHGVRQDTGKRVVINCGGEQVLAQCLRLDIANEWPVVIQIIQVGKEKAGRTRPYKLRRVDSGAPAGQGHPF